MVAPSGGLRGTDGLPRSPTIFFRYSAGCPRLVSSLADRVLLYAFSQGVRPIPRVLVEMKAKELDSARSHQLWEGDVW